MRLCRLTKAKLRNALVGYTSRNLHALPPPPSHGPQALSGRTQRGTVDYVGCEETTVEVTASDGAFYSLEPRASACAGRRRTGNEILRRLQQLVETSHIPTGCVRLSIHPVSGPIMRARSMWIHVETMKRHRPVCCEILERRRSSACQS